jgi:hypothetical protein
MTDRPLVMLPAAVLERVPSLHEARTFFFDFGLLVSKDEGTTPIVVVLTDQSLVVASFPGSSVPATTMPHSSIVGVTRDGALLTIRNSHMPEMCLQLPKADTFAVHLINLQDRSMNRALRLGADGHASEKKRVSGVSTDRALRAAESTLAGADEADLGVIRFGYSSLRTAPPTVELDEGSDASSIQTLDNEVEDPPPEGLVDVQSACINPHSLHRRLRYFFLCYDRSKLLFIDDMVRQHQGREAELLRELQAQYGPEPNKLRWEAHDRLAHQREVNGLLRAQLRRAQDEILLLDHQSTQLERGAERTDKLRASFVEAMLHKSSSTSEAPFELLTVHENGGEANFFVAPATFFAEIKVQCRTVARAREAPLVSLRSPKEEDQIEINRHFFGTIAVDTLGTNFMTSVAQGGRHFFIPAANFLA